MDEPFFNFDSEEMDDEELYCESLLEELKKQQVCCEDIINNTLLLMKLLGLCYKKLYENRLTKQWEPRFQNIMLFSYFVVMLSFITYLKLILCTKTQIFQLSANVLLVLLLIFVRKWTIFSYNSFKQKRLQEYDWTKQSTNLNTKYNILQRLVKFRMS